MQDFTCNGVGLHWDIGAFTSVKYLNTFCTTACQYNRLPHAQMHRGTELFISTLTAVVVTFCRCFPVVWGTLESSLLCRRGFGPQTAETRLDDPREKAAAAAADSPDQQRPQRQRGHAVQQDREDGGQNRDQVGDSSGRLVHL